MEYTLRLLRDLVAIDSVNPSLVSGGAGEGEIARAIESELRSIGLDVSLEEVAPGRPNVTGVLQGRTPGPALMLCGHMDTVGVSGMEAPFDPVQRDDRLYGRGAQDMKGGLTAMIAAARRIARTGGPSAGSLIVAAVVDEEYASIGAEALAAGWKADMAVVAEPTDLVVAVGHRGFTWLEVVTRGVAAHGSRPKEGKDAVLRMGRVLSRLAELDRELQNRPAHPILGTGSLHASFISGGRELSTYPDLCTLQMERRSISGESADTALAEVQKILADLHAEDGDFDASARVLFDRPPYETPAGHPLPEALEEALRRIGRTPRRDGVSFWTDAAVIGHAGIPSVVFGPGGAGLHSREEYVRIDDVIACRDALVELAGMICR